MNDEEVNGLEAVIDRWEGDFAVLRIADGQELLWPGERLPAGLSEGSAVKLMIFGDKGLTEYRRGQAKDILNEIFEASDNGGND